MPKLSQIPAWLLKDNNLYKNTNISKEDKPFTPTPIVEPKKPEQEEIETVYKKKPKKKIIYVEEDDEDIDEEEVIYKKKSVKKQQTSVKKQDKSVKKQESSGEDEDVDLDEEGEGEDHEELEDKEIIIDHEAKLQFLKGLGIDLNKMSADEEAMDVDDTNNMAEEEISSKPNLKSSKKREKEHIKEELKIRKTEEDIIENKLENPESVEFYEKKFSQIPTIQYTGSNMLHIF